MHSPSAADRNSTVRTLAFMVLVVLALAALLTARATAPREEQRGRWGELYRRAGDTYVNLAYLATGMGLSQEMIEGFLDGAHGYYSLAAECYPKDVRITLSRALAEYISREGQDDARARLASALRGERREPERTQLRTVLLALPKGKPEPVRLAAAEEIIASLTPGPWALSDAYGKAGDGTRASTLWDRGWERATPLLPRLAAMLAVCGLILLAGVVGLIAFLLSRGRAEREAPPAAAWDLREALEALLLFVVVQLLVGGLVVRAPAAVQPFFFLLPVAVGGLAAIAWVWFISPPGRQLGWRRDHLWRRVLAGVAAAGVMVLPATMLGSAVQNLLGLPPEEHPLVPVLATSTGWSAPLFLILGACAIIPALEETLFRGVLYGALRRHWSAWPAIVVSAVVFAAGHLSVVGFLPFLLVGMLLAWLYERSGSLLVSAAAHGAFNAFNVAMLVVLFR
jgi:membrane protease YdiL (CAAX protease family)